MVNNPAYSKTLSKFTGSEIFGAKTKKRMGLRNYLTKNDAQDTHCNTTQVFVIMGSCLVFLFFQIIAVGGRNDYNCSRFAPNFVFQKRIKMQSELWLLWQVYGSTSRYS